MNCSCFGPSNSKLSFLCFLSFFEAGRPKTHNPPGESVVQYMGPKAEQQVHSQSALLAHCQNNAFCFVVVVGGGGHN